MATLHRDHLCDDEEQDRIKSINGDDDEERKKEKKKKEKKVGEKREKKSSFLRPAPSIIMSY